MDERRRDEKIYPHFNYFRRFLSYLVFLTQFCWGNELVLGEE